MMWADLGSAEVVASLSLQAQYRCLHEAQPLPQQHRYCHSDSRSQRSSMHMLTAIMICLQSTELVEQDAS